MKFEVGDPIIVLKSKEEGKIVEILADGMLSINVNGTTFPIFAEEVDHPYLYWFLDKNKQATNTTTKHAINTAPQFIKAKTEQVNKTSYPKGLKLVFVPVYQANTFDDIIERVKIYISNNLHQRFSFKYYFESRDGEKFKLQSELDPQQNFYVHDISYEHLATNPYFEFKASEIFDGIVSTVTTVDFSLFIKPKKLLSIVHEMHLKNLPYFSFDIIEAIQQQQTETVEVKPHVHTNNDTTIVKPKPLKKQKPKKTEAAPLPADDAAENQPQNLPYCPDWDDLFIEPYVVDLHIEKIHPNHKLLSGADKLAFQLLAATKVLDIAYKRNLNTLILIHGNGKGVLQREIFAILDQTKYVHSYVNKEDKRFGLGATEIFLGY